ncbi:MAG TPA: helix-turn-helix domain-containing protein [Gaiellaceae bacterium]|nr:helix-turn-helix domain-containing protein [Gaiellaceae bacterium]
MATNSCVPDTLPELLTVRQLADYLSIPVSTIYLWRSKRQGPTGFRVGKRLVFRAADVARWLEEQAP